MRAFLAVVIASLLEKSCHALHPQAEPAILDPYATARFAATQRSDSAPQKMPEGMAEALVQEAKTLVDISKNKTEKTVEEAENVKEQLPPPPPGEEHKEQEKGGAFMKALVSEAEVLEADTEKVAAREAPDGPVGEEEAEQAKKLADLAAQEADHAKGKEDNSDRE